MIDLRSITPHCHPTKGGSFGWLDDGTRVIYQTNGIARTEELKQLFQTLSYITNKEEQQTHKAQHTRHI